MDLLQLIGAVVIGVVGLGAVLHLSGLVKFNFDIEITRH